MPGLETDGVGVGNAQGLPGSLDLGLARQGEQPAGYLRDPPEDVKQNIF